MCFLSYRCLILKLSPNKRVAPSSAMSLHTDNRGCFERPRTPPSPTSIYTSIYTSRVASPVSGTTSHERSGGPHDGLTADNIDDLFEALLDKLDSGYLHRQNLKRQLQEAEDTIAAANWDMFLLEHQRRNQQNPLGITGARSPPHPNVHPLSPRRPGTQPSQPPARHAHLAAKRDAALLRRQGLWEEVKTATAGVEDQMVIFWRLLRERERLRGGVGGVVERARRLLIPASLDELEGVRGLLDELLPRGLTIGSPGRGRPAPTPSRFLTPPPRSRRVAPGLQTWI